MPSAASFARSGKIAKLAKKIADDLLDTVKKSGRQVDEATEKAVKRHARKLAKRQVDAERAAQRAATQGKSGMVGAKGQKLDGSQTVWERGSQRVDVENFNPGRGPGNMHFQDQARPGEKWRYNFQTNQFDGMPNRLSRQLGRDADFQRGVDRGKRLLGED